MNRILSDAVKKPIRISFRALFGWFLWGFTVFAAVFLSDSLAEGVREGVTLCTKTVLPSIFPFMILSDLLVSYGMDAFPPAWKKSFERVFGIGGDGLTAFTVGILCGFPLGVKTAVSLYRAGRLTREETERLIGFTNNAGPAFLIAGIGAGLCKSAKIGIFLWASVILSAVTVGLLFAKRGEIGNRRIPPSASAKSTAFSLTDSITGSAGRSISVCSFILFFSALTSLLKNFIFRGRNRFLLCLLLSMIEVSSAIREVVASTQFSLPILMGFCGFSVGFSGLSVHLQALSFLKGTDLSAKTYFQMKFVQGIFCAIFSVLSAFLLSFFRFSSFF